jgi:hypothetical protein
MWTCSVGVPATSENEPPAPTKWAWSASLPLRSKPPYGADEVVEGRRGRDVGDADPQVVDVPGGRISAWWTASALLPSGSSRKPP